MIPVIFSEDRIYRYVLRRRVGWTEGTCLFIMLNPSTADETKNDPTIRRCISFAQAWGYGILTVCNIFALRATNSQLLRAVRDPIGPENDRYIAHEIGEAGRVVAAWGNNGALLNRSTEMRRLLPAYTLCLGMTGKGEPRHPLYVPGWTELMLLRQGP